VLPSGLNAEEEVDTNLMGVLEKGVVGPAVPAFLAASGGAAGDVGVRGWPRCKRV